MNQIAFYIGERCIHWSAVIITLGLLCCLSFTIALYRQRSETLRAIAVYFPLASILSLLLARLDRKSTRLNSSHPTTSRMPSSA